jgi:hypothetical protein
MTMEVIDLCGQALCMSEATCSFVWPGRGRSFACRPHADKAIAVAMALGLSLESLDIQPANGRHSPFREEPFR